MSKMGVRGQKLTTSPNNVVMDSCGIGTFHGFPENVYE